MNGAVQNIIIRHAAAIVKLFCPVQAAAKQNALLSVKKLQPKCNPGLTQKLAILEIMVTVKNVV